MKITRAGTVSGCVVWIIVFAVLNLCFLPAAMMIGGVTSASHFAMQTMEPILCPDGTTAESYSYETTTTDEFGNSQPSTAYELHCRDANGTVVKEDPVSYAFIWMGSMVMIGLLLAALFAFALAAPAGALIGRLFEHRNKTNITANIEPE